MNVRPAGVADAAAIADLSTSLGYPTDPPAIRERLGRLLPRPNCLVLVAEADHAVVGWIHAEEQELLESGERCEILGLIVDAARRRHGVGRRLVEAVEMWARERGLDRITVRSNIVRAESHPFYARLGYERVKTQHAYRKHLTESSE